MFVLLATVSSTFSKFRSTCKHVSLEKVLETAARSPKTENIMEGHWRQVLTSASPRPSFACVLPCLLFSIVGLVHLLSSVLSMPLALCHSLLLVFGCKCTYPSIHVHCLAGVTPTNHAEMLDSLVRVPKLDERDRVARNKGHKANNRQRTVASITRRSNAFHLYFP